MITSQAAETPKKPLRVWPGIVIVVLLWIARFGVKAAIPGIKGFGLAVMSSLALTVLLIIWWAFFSRAKRLERLAALAVMVAGVGVAWLLRHESMWVPWLIAYALPVLSLAFVAWAVLTRNLPNRLRHATMVATILIACFGWLLFRQNGIDGDHVATFGWRWRASPEERLLAAETNEAPATAN
ncbi:MAG TPA: hypothetical protein VM941_01380, partial [Pyrinomonadaceae bacterium]|nr:hypothetical protein [Pyrinomonadaceae bacterium]